MDTQQALGGSGHGYSLHYEGTEYRFCPFDQSIKADIESRLKSHAYAVLDEVRKHLDDDAYNHQVTQLRQELTAGEYSFGGAQFARTLQSGKGGMILLKTLLVGAEKMDDLQLARMVKVCKDQLKLIMKQIMEDAFPKSPPKTERDSPSDASAESTSPSSTPDSSATESVSELMTSPD